MSILAHVRKKIISRSEIMSHSQSHKPLSIKGALGKDIFRESKENTKSKAKLNEMSTLKLQKEESKDEATLEVDAKYSKMEEEPSYHMSAVSNEDDKDVEEDKTHNAEDCTYRDPDNKPVVPLQSMSGNYQKALTDDSKPYPLVISKKWKKKLNISRDTIVEVDEEHKSDTTNQKSKFIA